MTEEKIPSALSQMGYRVCGIRNGVYLLRRYEGPDGELTFDGVGLFVALGPIAEAQAVYFYEYNALPFRKSPEEFARLLETWGALDARRLGESGLQATVIDYPRSFFGNVVHDEMPVERPSDGRQRLTALMESGDVICYN